MINVLATLFTAIDPYAIVIGVITVAGVVYSLVGAMCYDEEDVELTERMAD